MSVVEHYLRGMLKLYPAAKRQGIPRGSGVFGPFSLTENVPFSWLFAPLRGDSIGRYQESVNNR